MSIFVKLIVVTALLTILFLIWLIFIRDSKKEPTKEVLNIKDIIPSPNLEKQTTVFIDTETNTEIRVNIESLDIDELRELGHKIYELDSFLKEAKKWQKERKNRGEEVKKSSPIVDLSLPAVPTETPNFSHIVDVDFEDFINNSHQSNLPFTEDELSNIANSSYEEIPTNDISSILLKLISADKL